MDLRVQIKAEAASGQMDIAKMVFLNKLDFPPQKVSILQNLNVLCLENIPYNPRCSHDHIGCQQKDLIFLLLRKLRGEECSSLRLLL